MENHEEFLEAAIAIKYFDSILTNYLKRTNSAEIFLIQKIYRMNFTKLDMYTHNFFETDGKETGRDA